MRTLLAASGLPFDNRGMTPDGPTPNDPAPRRALLARLLPDEGLDAFVITHPVNVTYLTGFSGDTSVLILGRERAVLVSDPRYTRQIAEECGDLPTHIRPPAQKLYDTVAEVLTKLGHRNVG